jgi:hypothetical protein
MSIKTYSELITIPTFVERFRYLKLGGVIGEETFGFDRYLNQMLYKSQRWISTRDYVIIRDNGCDLAMEGHDIRGKILVHHMNPITIDDILHERDCVFDPEFLISTMLSTHNAIHYGDESLLVVAPIERRQNDTCPWRHN